MARPRKTRNLRCYDSDDGVTPEVITIAKNRIMYLLHSWRLMDYDMERLLISCYMQGATDMAESIVNRGLLREVSEQHDPRT